MLYLRISKIISDGKRLAGDTFGIFETAKYRLQ
jgi:hypothetical protein